MSMAQLSPISVLANPAHVNPQVKADQVTSVPQVNEDAQKVAQTAKTDTVAFSEHAVKKVVNDVYSAVQEMKEKAAEAATRAAKDKA